MSSRYVSLKENATRQLPPGFVKGLIDGTRNIYPESYQAMTNDPNLDEEQARYVLGHYRRSLGETMFSRLAGQHGLKQVLVQPENGGCKHVRVTAGNLSFVLCHVRGSDTFPKHSDSREQTAQINDHLCQAELFPELLKEASNNVNHELYGIIIHSEMADNKRTFGSIKLGFPNTNFDGWIEEPICLLEISDIQDRMYQKEEDLQAQVQKASPTWKKLGKNKDQDAVKEE